MSTIVVQQTAYHKLRQKRANNRANLKKGLDTDLVFTLLLGDFLLVFLFLLEKNVLLLPSLPALALRA